MASQRRTKTPGGRRVTCVFTQKGGALGASAGAWEVRTHLLCESAPPGPLQHRTLVLLALQVLGCAAGSGGADCQREGEQQLPTAGAQPGAALGQLRGVLAVWKQYHRDPVQGLGEPAGPGHLPARRHLHRLLVRLVLARAQPRQCGGAYCSCRRRACCLHSCTVGSFCCSTPSCSTKKEGA